MNIYLACTVRGDRGAVAGLRSLVASLEDAGHTILTRHLLDDNVDGQRAWVEEVVYTGADGNGLMMVRPGDYEVYFSRGFEYDLVKVPVHVEAGNAASASAKLTRVVDTTGWISYDGHIHHEDSIDSAMDLGSRLRASCTRWRS